MASILLEDIDICARAVPRRGHEMPEMAPTLDIDDVAMELGIWLSGLESFLSGGYRPFCEGTAQPNAEREFRLVHSGLQRCSLLTSLLVGSHGTMFPGSGGLLEALRDAVRLSRGMIDSRAFGRAEWQGWARVLTHRLTAEPAFRRFIRNAEIEAETCLPAALVDALSRNENAELSLILPRFATILKWLSVIGRMLENDEPLKPALLIFARINEQILELTTFINHRVDAGADTEGELLAALDAAAYTASLELKKVYSQALAGIVDVRPSPSVYARMETAQSLLSDGFQQIVAGFARLLEPKADVFELFPNFRVKRERSIVLCRELRELVTAVRETETDPGKKRVDALRKSLRQFMRGTVKYLFYKDTETVERFVEEILVTKQNKDLVPILHRFGAYLETLHGQVIMRAVLEGQPL